jgi:hypothetical protein
LQSAQEWRTLAGMDVREVRLLSSRRGICARARSSWAIRATAATRNTRLPTALCHALPDNYDDVHAAPLRAPG